MTAIDKLWLVLDLIPSKDRWNMLISGRGEGGLSIL